MNDNRLIHEQSPYLLQHAHNPVDWYPWGEEAFTKAREKDIPLFLSIGYAACHWCHVMERECFMNEEVAALLNKSFIAVKVDREEYPEIDRIYMTVCQLMTGTGGWPLSIFLTPDLKPFYAATYIPRTSGSGMPGMLDLLPYLNQIWKERREEVYVAGERIFNALKGEDKEPGSSKEKGYTPIKAAHEALSILTRTFDKEFGGFGSAPKFPSIPQILFLLDYGEIFQNESAHSMAIETLRAISKGGIRDHIGYGFHRYATDRAWKIPHFEKMLYDQALNAVAFSYAWQITSDPEMKNAAEDIFQYICNNLTSLEGAFYSAEDADSPEGEGAFYLWSAVELQGILSRDEYLIAEQYWNIKTEGNVPLASGIPSGNNIIASDSRIKRDLKGGSEFFLPEIERIRKNLYKNREKRAHPRLDDKVLADWNGLTIEAFAIAARVMDEHWMISRAQRAAAFILSSMKDADGNLYHRWRNGHVAITGTAQDYVFLAAGLLSLFQTTGDPDNLIHAIQITDAFVTNFIDEKGGGLFGTDERDTQVPIRLKDEYDGPIPSASGKAFQLLNELAIITGNNRYADLAQKIVSGMNEILTRAPHGVLSLLSGVCKEKNMIRAVITGDKTDPIRQELWRVLNSRFIPGLVPIPLIPEHHEQLSPFVADLPLLESAQKTAIWICAGHSCLPPVSDPTELANLLDQITHSSGQQDFLLRSGARPGSVPPDR
jgi:uncharacterized protein YyaL (SSP411 family)